ncbi:IS30 family transposase [Microbulbifer sp. SSSA002]|uniref:IS30 family transposase n=1 Tax=unclassified Microbulbifer TaxID=2619833 RepID=UPI004039F65B
MVAQATIALLEPYRDFVHTITADNGKEFALHEKIGEALDAKVYFAHPYSSWERGLNENTNGLLRQYFPKKTDFKLVDQADVEAAVERLNNRPRKMLGYKTPKQVMGEYTAAAAA